jgi:Zinc-binding dehydrogenase
MAALGNYLNLRDVQFSPGFGLATRPAFGGFYLVSGKVSDWSELATPVSARQTIMQPTLCSHRKYAQVNLSSGTLAAGLGFAIFGLMKVLPDRRKLRWYNSGTFRDQHPGWFRGDLTILFDLLLARSIQPVIDRKFRLSDASLANEMLEKGQAAGKLVLLPQT